jgi:GT2 family glycosyltransferase
MNQLIISMVVYKTPILKLDQVFKMLLKGLTGVRHEVHILDNGNDINLSAWCEQNKFAYYNLGCNVGFGRGHNEIFRKTYKKNTIYLFLNPDLYMSGEHAKKILALFKKHPRMGLISPKLLNPDGSVQLTSRLIPNPFTLIARFVFKKNFGAIPYHHYKHSFSAPFLSGACIFIRGSLFKALGGFDRRYFMYMEDLDLCRKIQLKGYSLLLFTDAFAIHKHAKGSYKHWKLFLHHLVSMIRYFNKWGWIIDSDRSLRNQIFLKKLN